MKVLAIDTATDAVVTGVAQVSRDGVAVLADRTVADHRRHAELLTTLIAESLAEAELAGRDLDAVVVGCGPGPFTGLRVGLATAAAYADALGIAVYGVCSLDAIVAQEDLRRGGSIGTMLAVTDARRREVYWALYDAGRRIAGPNVVAPQTLADDLARTPIDTVVGTEGFTERFGAEVGSARRPSVAGLVTVAARDVLARAVPEPLVPLYLRRPDAVELKDQKKRR